MSSRAFLGAGLGFPLTPDRDGRMPRAAAAEKVRQSIGVILETAPGERIMLPEFGCGLNRFLMQPNSSGVRAQLKRVVEAALKTWEPRIALERVEVLPGEDPSLVLIEIGYTHLRDGRRDNLVYPFYLA